MDKGVDGFRIDSFNHIYENITFSDEPLSHLSYVTSEEYDYLDHPYSKNQPESYKVAQDWRSLLDKYSQKGSTRLVFKLAAKILFDMKKLEKNVSDRALANL